ncbi:MAG: hypothetical protein AAFV53_22045 [Myxococcota bacterium]
MKIIFPQPDLISTLLGSADPDVRAQAVEIIHSLWEREAIDLAARIADGFGDPTPWHGAARRVLPGTDCASERESLLRYFALDCALHALPALEIFTERPWDGFAGRLPDITVVDEALDTFYGRGGLSMSTIQYRLDREISACRRWTCAATKKRQGPAAAMRRALEALRAIRHACTSTTQNSLRQVIRAARRAAIDPMAEAAWQRGWFVECLMGQHTPVAFGVA